MAAYVLARVEVHDMDAYQEYVKRSGPAVAAFGGRFLARGGDKQTLEGDDITERLVIVEFDNMDTAQRWWASEQYQEARGYRLPCSTATFTLLDGV